MNPVCSIRQMVREQIMAFVQTSLDDIDFEHPDRRDVRAHQFRKIANAVATMLIAIDKTAKTSPFSKETLSAAGVLAEKTQ